MPALLSSPPLSSIPPTDPRLSRLTTTSLLSPSPILGNPPPLSRTNPPITQVSPVSSVSPVSPESCSYYESNHTSFVVPPMYAAHEEQPPDLASIKKEIRERRRQRALANPWGKARLNALEQPSPNGALQAALVIYDPGLHSDMPLETLQNLVGIYQLGGIEFPCVEALREIMDMKIMNDIESTLGQLGYTQFSCFGRRGRGYMRISGENAQPLPLWMKVPFLIPSNYEEIKIIPETCANQKIDYGHCLQDEADCPIGTVGPIMSSPRPGGGSVHVVLTACHVVPEMATEMHISSGRMRKVKVEVSRTSRRDTNGRMLKSFSSPWACEVAFLMIHPNDFQIFNSTIFNLNCHGFGHGPASSADMRDPLAIPRYSLLQSIIDICPPLVFKRGMSTDVTMGHLVEISKEKPRGWWPSDPRKEIEIDDMEWLGYVRWIAGIPFSAEGDSGSLVFAIEDGVFIPLGVHVGAPSSHPGHSCFVSLETFCLEAEDEG